MKSVVQVVSKSVEVHKWKLKIVKDSTRNEMKEVIQRSQKGRIK